MSKHIIFACTSEVKGVPSEIKILPFGNVKSQKGNFIVDDESFKEIRNHFKGRGLDLVIDYEHQTLENVQAPAGGWIKDIEKQNDAIVAKVEWTPKAEEYLKNKEYRYLSPVVLVRKRDNKAVVLHSVALTNTPAIDNMYPIINSIDLKQYECEEGENKMDLKEIAKKLGLPEDASEDEIKAALTKAIEEFGKNNGAVNPTDKEDPTKKEENPTKKEETTNKEEDTTKTEVVANKTILSLLGVGEDAKTEDVAAAIIALKNPDGFVSKTEFLALKEKLDKNDSNELVMKALKDGKITPAQKAWAEEYALKDSKGFKAFVEKAPRVVPIGEIKYGEEENNQNDFNDETTTKVLKMLGVSQEDIKKYGEVDLKC